MNKTKSNKEKSCRQVITPKSGNRTGRATPTLFGRVSGCVHFFGAGWSPSPFKGFEAVFGSFLRLCGGRKKKQDKGLGSLPRLSPGTSARSAGSYGSFCGLENGVKNGRETKFCGRYPAALTPTRKNQGSTRRKETMSQKEKFALYLTPEMKARLERRYTEDGSRSLTGFIENAINFYLDYLSANNAGMFLPASVQSYLDGRLDQFEDRMASLLYKQSVELDMVMSILADCVNLDEAYLRRKRAESVANVKKLNGRIRLEQLAKRTQELRNGDDAWQD